MKIVAWANAIRLQVGNCNCANRSSLIWLVLFDFISLCVITRKAGVCTRHTRTHTLAARDELRVRDKVYEMEKQKGTKKATQQIKSDKMRINQTSDVHMSLMPIIHKKNIYIRTPRPSHTSTMQFAYFFVSNDEWEIDRMQEIKWMWSRSSTYFKELSTIEYKTPNSESTILHSALFVFSALSVCMLFCLLAFFSVGSHFTLCSCCTVE